MTDLTILSCLGLGDAFLINSIIRHHAKERRVLYPCWHHNVGILSEMFSDCDVFLYPIWKEEEAIELADKSPEALRLGYYGKDFDPTKFDQEFYRQAGMDFEKRWSEFKLGSYKIQKEHSLGEFNFVHDDVKRGFEIDNFKCQNNGFRLKPNSNLSSIISAIFYASEIHVINSSMLILADSIETPNAKRLVLHHYARKTIYPTLSKAWEVI